MKKRGNLHYLKKKLTLLDYKNQVLQTCPCELLGYDWKQKQDEKTRFQYIKSFKYQ